MQINKKAILLAFSLFSLVTHFTISVSAWSNGGWSEDPSHPEYGTHDWIAQHALDWLPREEKRYIVENMATYLYGTELPDNGGTPDGIGDTAKHHIYYNSGEVMTDDAAAVRASDEYIDTLNFLRLGDLVKAARNAGIMSHYIVDVAVFGHVMGSGTEWGEEKHHSDYESYVNERTSSYDARFNSYLFFDGNLSIISAYNAAKDLAYDTTFNVDGNLTCVWMDQNYNWSNPTFANRCGESLNLAVNYLADTLHTLYAEYVESLTTESTVAWEASVYTVVTLSNSTITGFEFNQPLKQISFSVSGSTGTMGFCNTTIPNALLSGPYRVLIDGSSITHVETCNATHTFLHFTYSHSTHAVQIIGTTAIPEFPSAITLPLLLISALIVLALRKRDHKV